MNRNIIYIAFAAFLWIFLGCQSSSKKQTTEPYKFDRTGAKVSLTKNGSQFEMQLDGEPFYIHGGGGRTHLETLREIGGNAIRTWSTYRLDSLLDQADRAGLKVMVGLDVVAGRLGLDYTDPEMVAEQKERIRKDILRYKDHPALLMWNVGNELELFYAKDELYHAVNDLAEMIHELDPDHLVTISLGIKAEWINKIAELCPAIDVLSINVFSLLPTLPALMNSPEVKWKGPYIVTEWSSKGYWEVGFVDWDAPREPSSREKVSQMMQWYQNAIAWDKDRCLGSFVFYWGNKQERTHTWFSLFSPDGEKTSRVDALHYLWQGEWPVNRAPDVDSIRFLGHSENYSIYVGQEEEIVAEAVTFDAEEDELSLKWEILTEGNYRNTFGGDREKRPVAIPNLIQGQNGKRMTFTSPKEVGAYRLFVYVRDGHGNFASGNIPFYVSNKRVTSAISFSSRR